MSSARGSRVKKSSKAANRKRRPLIIAWSAIAVVVLGVLIILYVLSAQTPAWWSPADPNSQTVQAIGEHVENAVVSDFTKVRSTDERRWSLDLDSEWINDWLVTRLPQWAANRNLPWASKITQANVVIEPDTIRIGLMYDLWGQSHALSMTFTPEFKADDPPTLVGSNFHFAVGRMPVPVNFILNQLLGTSNGSDSSTQQVVAWFEGKPVDPVIKLADNRRVIVRGLTVSKDLIHLDLETLPAK